MLFNLNRNLPDNITSYDLLKSFAIITMIIDHIGVYIFPDQQEWRMIGRFSMPVWLFLVGYANSRDLSKSLWIGGGILVVLNLLIGDGFFELNILFTIIFVRLSLDYVMKLYFASREGQVFTTFLLILLVVPSSMFFDYGTHAWLFAMLGYLVRHKEKLDISTIHLLLFAGVISFARAGSHLFFFDFNFLEMAVSSIGIFIICIILFNFELKTHSDFTVFKSKSLKNILKIMGRWSLEIYVAHLVFLELISFYLYPEKYAPLNFSFF